MIVMLSGEGPTDLGQCRNGQGNCKDGNFKIGPMTVLLDQMLGARLKFSLLSTGSYRYVSKSALVERAKARKSNGSSFSFVGKKREQETGYFFINAWMLAEFSMEAEEESKDDVIAILFRDCDGTHSNSSALWEVKRKSMLDGFARANFSRGVPMLPKPKSEAWMLCAAKNSVHGCAHLEELSGNDASPNSAKMQLDGVFGAHQSGDELCEWLEANRIDEDKLSTMPSFYEFKERLNEVVADVIH